LSVARSQHSVCTFNDKFLFVFGGRKMQDGKIIRNAQKIYFHEPYSIVKEVEVFEIAKNTWKTINYISEAERLMVISAGSMQIAGSQILIFGGLIPKSASRD
jgi:Galactose oxidase, central domain